MIKEHHTDFPEVVVLKMTPYQDDRGSFFEAYNKAAFSELGIVGDFVQDNHSVSKQGVLRGLHYQIKQIQGKLVRVIVGEIFDVAVDLRRSSPNFGKWIGVHLTAGDFSQIWIPPGFGHGFYTCSDMAEILYKTTDYYAPEWERTIKWNDPRLGIKWPLIDGKQPLLSPKDALGKSLADAEVYE